jgi:hypothetical protein
MGWYDAPFARQFRGLTLQAHHWFQWKSRHEGMSIWQKQGVGHEG